MKRFLKPLMPALSISLISSCGVKIVDENSSCNVEKSDSLLPRNKTKKPMWIWNLTF